MSVKVEGGGGVSVPTVIPTVHFWALLGDYEAAIAEGSHVFNFPAIDFDDDSKLVLVVDGNASAALDLQLRINTLATAIYFTDGRKIAGGVETLIDLNGQTFIRLLGGIAINQDFAGICEILLPKAGAGANDQPHTISTFGSGLPEQDQVLGLMTTSQASITDVEVLTSTSTWPAGTRMTLYRVQRVPYQVVPT